MSAVASHTTTDDPGGMTAAAGSATTNILLAPLSADCTVASQGVVDNIVVELQGGAAGAPPPHPDNNTTAGIDNVGESGRLEYGVMLSDTEVANGFVKDGSSLPYVFEANEAGKCDIFRIRDPL